MWRIKLLLKTGYVELGDVRMGRPGWAEFLSSGILKLEFNFIGHDKGKNIPLCITLSGMEKYNFFVEAMKGIGSNAIKIQGIWFLGKLPGEERVKGFVIGDTIRCIDSLEGKEYNGTQTLGWKEGILGDKPIVNIRKL